MVNENFKTLKDLYKRVLPALKTKVSELKRGKIAFLTEEDIWNYLRRGKWKNETDLTLLDIVNDILFIDEREILSYMQKRQEQEQEEMKDNEKVKEKKEKIDKEDTIL